MKRLRGILPLAAAVVIAGLLLTAVQPPQPAGAHPLGNFSVNRLAILDINGDGVVTVRYVVDAAEIPTFQKLRSIDEDGDGAVSAVEKAAYLDDARDKIVTGLVFEVNERHVLLSAVESDLTLHEGQGGLQTMRTVIDAVGLLPVGWQDGAGASFRDENYDGETGWRDVVVRPGAGVGLLRGEVTTFDVTSELTAYPEDLLKSAPAVSELEFSFGAGTTAPANSAPQPEDSTVSRDAAGKTLGRFASLVSQQKITPGVVALGLLLAAAWGAMHALGPGHGKTVVAAYLVGERGTWQHALYLGGIVTATHTLSVFALGGVAIFASSVVSADELIYWLSVASGGMVGVLGGFLLLTRLRRLFVSGRTSAHHHWGKGHEHTHAHGDHEQGHSDGHADGHGSHGNSDRDHGHSHVPTQPGWRGLLALGISGGLVPCPTALVVMLGAIAIDRTVYGLVLVTAFSVGLAGVLTAVGLLMVYGRHLLARSFARPILRTKLAHGLIAASPVLSALGILGAGLLLASRSVL